MKSLFTHNVLAVLIIGVLFGTTYFTNPSFFKASKAEAGSVNENVSGWAWSENIGWISFNDTNEATGYAGAPYGVKADTANKAIGGVGLFTGKAWSENIGWINFDASDVAGCPTSVPAIPCQAQVDWSTGKVTGWAHAFNGSVDSGWDGWIKLAKASGDSGPSYGVTISGNKFSGYAWGGDDGAGVAGVVGWIDFALTVGGVPVGVQVSAPPCTSETVTAWGLCQALTQCTGGGTQSSVAGIQVGICPSGGTVTQGCTIASQTCTAPSSSNTRIRYRQF